MGGIASCRLSTHVRPSWPLISKNHRPRICAGAGVINRTPLIAAGRSAWPTYNYPATRRSQTTCINSGILVLHNSILMDLAMHSNVES